MQLSQIDPKIISITQLRRDIDVLEQVLAQNDQAFVMRNQELLFVAWSPQKYQSLNTNNTGVVEEIQSLRDKYAGANAGSKFVIKMRDEAGQRWTK
ncbi:MAG: hypothetical protein Q7S14_00750 [bacterium]|nr:hypothetical protein [bacterium]